MVRLKIYSKLPLFYGKAFLFPHILWEKLHGKLFSVPVNCSLQVKIRIGIRDSVRVKVRVRVGVRARVRVYSVHFSLLIQYTINWVELDLYGHSAVASVLCSPLCSPSSCSAGCCSAGVCFYMRNRLKFNSATNTSFVCEGI